jgi:hypothetical protein
MFFLLRESLELYSTTPYLSSAATSRAMLVFPMPGSPLSSAALALMVAECEE